MRNGCETVFPGKTNLDVCCRFWYNRLWDFAISLRRFDGSPFRGAVPAMNSDYLNWQLFVRGYAEFLRNGENLYAVECSIQGYNYYRYPAKLLCTSPYIKPRSIMATVGKDAVFIKNNKFAKPIIHTISYYAKQLGEIQSSLNVNLLSCRGSKIFRADDANDANKIRRLIDDLSAGNIGVIEDGTTMDKIFNGEDHIPVISTPSEYLVDKYLQNIRSVINEFLVAMGVPCSAANQIKAERNTVDEVHANDAEVAANRAFWLDPAREACEQFNSIAGTDITVTYIGEEATVDDRAESADESQPGAAGN